MKNCSSRTVAPVKCEPVVSVSNYITVRPAMQWENRTLSDYELVHVVQGNLEYDDSARSARISEGDTLLISPGVPHLLRYLDPARDGIITCIHFTVESCRGAGDECRLEPSPPLVTSTGGDRELLEMFKRCSVVFHGHGAYRRAMISCITRQIIIHLAEYWTGNRKRLPPRTAEMVAFLRSNVTSSVSRRTLAERFHITPEHVNYIFKTHLNTTPTAFINTERVLLACRLIQNEGLSVKEAAERVGFSDQFYFSRTFKRIMGVTPGGVRRSGPAKLRLTSEILDHK